MDFFTPKHTDTTTPTVPNKGDKVRRKRRALSDSAPQRSSAVAALLTVAADTPVDMTVVLPPPPEFKRLKMDNCPDASVGFTSLRQFIEFVEHNRLSDNYAQLTNVVRKGRAAGGCRLSLQSVSKLVSQTPASQVPVLKDLDAMVGMSALKLQVIHQVRTHTVRPNLRLRLVKQLMQAPDS
jgi:hypothetical protein